MKCNDCIYESSKNGTWGSSQPHPCSNCIHREGSVVDNFKEKTKPEEYHSYCGDEDLWNKYKYGQEFLKGEPVSEKKKISAIYRESEKGKICLNIGNTSMPYIPMVKKGVIKFKDDNGGFDEIRLFKR